MRIDMTDKELKAKILGEIERLFDLDYPCDNYEQEVGYHSALNDVRDFINYLPEEPVSDDLEEAAKHYLYSNILYDDVYVGNPTDKDCIEMFKAGAEWQKVQDYFKIIYPKIITEGTIEQYAQKVAYDMSNDWAIDNPTWDDVQNACKLGAKWQKEHNKEK